MRALRTIVLTASWCLVATALPMAERAPAAAAARAQDLVALRQLLRNGADPNAKEPDGATALHWAAHWDDQAAAGLLLDARADVNATNDYGATPLWLASQNGSAGMIRVLLEHGAAPGATLPSGETALMAAARTGSTEAVHALLKAGAPVNARESERGQTALMWALAEGHVGVARLLLDNGADLMLTSVSANTPLMFAARQGDVAAVDLLVSRGASLDDVSADGTTALIIAIQRGQTPVVRWLIDHGANPNIDAAGYTALHWAAARWETVQTYDYDQIEGGEWSHLIGLGPVTADIVKSLLDHGADVNARTKTAPPRFGFTAFERRYTTGATAFYLAALSADVPLMQLLVARGADPGLAASDGSTSLMVASGLAAPPFESRISESARIEAVTLALTLGQDVNARNSAGNTALHGAAMGGHEALVTFLIGHGADRNARNKAGATALGTAEDGFMFGGQLHVRPRIAALLRQFGATK